MECSDINVLSDCMGLWDFDAQETRIAAESVCTDEHTPQSEDARFGKSE
jgi:hypothetical protein